MHTAYLTVPDEFSFSECYSFLNRFSNECLHFANGGKVDKLIEAGGQLFITRLEPGATNHLIISYLNAVPSSSQAEEVNDYIREWLGLKADLKPFYAFAKKDKYLATLAQKYYGLRIIGIPDLFEALTWAIIGQQINLAFAFTLKQRFVEKYGTAHQFEGRTYFLHPSTAVIAATDPEEYLAMQFNRKKAEYLIGVAQAIENGIITKELLSALPFEDAREKLCKIRGVGNWTANYVLMKCFHKSESLPIEDAGLLNALKLVHNLNTKPTIEEAKALTAHWAGFQAHATFYLWRSLVKENDPVMLPGQ